MAMNNSETSSASWIEREAKVLLQNYRRLPVVMQRGEGCYLFDIEGRRYLDLFAGVAVDALGHAHPRWLAAMQAQLALLTQTSNLLYTTPMIELAERLVSISGMDRVFFCNSGAEANEAAIKIARKWGKQNKGASCYKIITFEGAFHGRTLGALSATAEPKYCDSFQPLVPGFVRLGLQPHTSMVERLEAAIRDPDVCAVMMESIQGESGVRACDARCLQGVRELCDRHHVLLILDEVQTGIARCGQWFDFQNLGVLPDIMPLAKGLGGGFPIGACLTRGAAASVLVPGDHGSTFAGSPLACASALAVLEVIESEGLLAQVQAAGNYFVQGLKSLQVEQPSLIKEVRGRGLMIGLEFTQPIARGLVQELLQAPAGQDGLLLNATSEYVLRFVPPLIITQAQLGVACSALRAALGKCS
jgi:acetylornithine/N-succinyldiaminopimelate aminotransferase